jgi:hypothetical protein
MKGEGKELESVKTNKKVINKSFVTQNPAGQGFAAANGGGSSVECHLKLAVSSFAVEFSNL